jgi:hypothetical protein
MNEGMYMRRILTTAILAAMLVLAMAPTAIAKTAEGATERGLTCFNAGPDNWTHCIDGAAVGGPRMFVMVFSEDGTVYFGDEQLRRDDKYAGEPCFAENLDTWEGPLGPDLTGDGVGNYFGCHNFDTGRG